MNRKLYDLKEIVAETGLPERTVRYYLSKVLEAPAGTPGRKSYYDQPTVDQLMLAQQILTRDYDPEKGEVKPTLREFRDWLDGLEEDEIRRLVEMPYRVKPKALTQGRTVVHRAKREDRQATFSSEDPQAAKDLERRIMYSLSPDVTAPSLSKKLDPSPKPAASSLPEASDSQGLPDDLQPSDTEDSKANTQAETTGRGSATDYLNRVMGPDAAGQKSRSRQQRSGGSQSSSGPWASHRFGDALEIRTRQPLTREQARQVRLAGQLLKSILEGVPS
ncbi:MAG: MerR family transcriptional regulator [Xanthomonadales bacterium]|jgi:hypothetical protein|nr:MerR family transcriptional regulator [Xanthomonadales bacterium]